MPTGKPTDNVVLGYTEGLMLAVAINFIQSFIISETGFFPRYYGTIPILIRMCIILLVEVPISTIFILLGKYAKGGVLGLSNMYPLMKGIFLFIAVMNPFMIYWQRYPLIMVRWFVHLLTLPPEEDYIFHKCSPPSKWVCVASEEGRTTQCCDFETVFTNCSTGMSYPLMENFERYVDEYNIHERPHQSIFSTYFVWSLVAILLIGHGNPQTTCKMAGLAVGLQWLLLVTDVWDCTVVFSAWPTALSFLLVRRASTMDTLKIILPLIKMSWMFTMATIPTYIYLGRRLDDSVSPFRMSLMVGLHRMVWAILGILRRGCLTASLAINYDRPMACMMEPIGHFILSTRALQLYYNSFGQVVTLIKFVQYMFTIVNWLEFNKGLHIYVLVESIVTARPLLAALHTKWIITAIIAFIFHCIQTFLVRIIDWRALEFFVRAMDLCMCLELWILLVGIFWGFGSERVIITLEYAQKMKFPDGFNFLLTMMPYFTTVLLIFIGLMYLDEVDLIKALHYRTWCILIPAGFIAFAILSSIAMVFIYFVRGRTFQELLHPNKAWGPKTAAARRHQLYFNPGEYNTAYDPFYMEDHMCLMDHPEILKKQAELDELLTDVPGQMLRLRRETPRVDLRRKLTRLIKEANSDMW